VSQCLPVARSSALNPSTITLGVAAYVTLAGGAVDDLNRELAGCCKVAFKIHVEVLPNGFRSSVPATDPFGEKQRYRINRGRDANGRVLVQP